MIGQRIRQIRGAQQRSLADVAKKAKISIATLSRIETDKQTLDLELFLTLARILDTSPVELLEYDNDGAHGLDPLVKTVVALAPRERAAFWREMVAAHRSLRIKGSRVQIRQLAHDIEALLAHVEFLREELEGVRKKLRRSSPAPANASR